jgi:hypothetical protein
VGQLLQQHADTLAGDRMLALESRAFGDVFDRQEDLLYLVARPINRIRPSGAALLGSGFS